MTASPVEDSAKVAAAWDLDLPDEVRSLPNPNLPYLLNLIRAIDQSFLRKAADTESSKIHG